MADAPNVAGGGSKAALLHEMHPKPTLLSDFILGSQDGIVNVLGIILGLAAAGATRNIVIIATLAALAAESIAMGAVAYTSTLSRRRLYLAEVAREELEMREVPEAERAEVRAVLVEWGYQGDQLDELLDHICGNPKAMLEFMMAFELKLSPVAATAPRASASVVGSATLIGHLVPLIPFFVLIDVFQGAVLAVILSAVALFAIGWYEAKITAGRWWRNGLQMLAIGLAGGFAGFLIGYILHAGGFY
ncbi:MAG: VIT1/CCC1 transporter family protein [Thermoplasmata archaeon]|nr:VIT1/CCC1 transporter family protein [Thermoplasmata archaeon]